MTPSDRTDDELELYLDDALDAPRRAAFEARLEGASEADAGPQGGLRAEVALQRMLDASLRRTFAPACEPEAADPPAAAAAAGDRRQRARAAIVDCLPGPETETRRIGNVPPRSALAAALVLVAVAAWTWFAVLRSDGPPAGPDDLAGGLPVASAAGVREGWVELHGELAASGVNCFTDGWSETVCGAPLTMRGGEAQIHGALADARLGDEVSGFAALVGTSPALLCVAPLASDPRPPLGAAGVPTGELYLFRRELGDVVLYELTPRDEPELLPLVERVPAAGGERR